MTAHQCTWAIILAAGEGSRLKSLTTDASGRSVPKQFCSLCGGRSLLGDAFARAHGVADPAHVVTIVALEHRSYWEPEVRRLPRSNVIVQPRNRGTAPGLLLPLLSILERDPSARVVVFPSDHHVSREPVLRTALHVALRAIARQPGKLTMLGIAPDLAETEYGWVVPTRAPCSLRNVLRFVEKPERELSERLLHDGGLWNSFIMLGLARTFVEFYWKRLPELSNCFRAAFALAAADREREFERLYAQLEPRDFSRDVLQGFEERLMVLEVPSCGWTDLGTPARVAECLRTCVRARRTARAARAAPLALDRAIAARTALDGAIRSS